VPIATIALEVASTNDALREPLHAAGRSIVYLTRVALGA